MVVPVDVEVGAPNVIMTGDIVNLFVDLFSNVFFFVVQITCTAAHIE